MDESFNVRIIRLQGIHLIYQHVILCTMQNLKVKPDKNIIYISPKKCIELKHNKIYFLFLVGYFTSQGTIHGGGEKGLLKAFY